MKKQLLLGSALLAAISAFPQQNRRIHSAENTSAQRIALMNKLSETAPLLVAPQQQTNPVKRTSATASNSLATWNPISGSINSYGVIVHNQKPLHYNEALNAVSFIHRKSATYIATPTIPNDLLSGIIVAQVSADGGNTWDSTCIWNHGTQTGRYPQGIIHNPSGNTSIGGAYVIGTGPALPYNPSATGNWAGSFFASKPLSAMTNSAGADMQFMSGNITYGGPYHPSVGKADFARYEITSTANGKVYLAAYLVNDANGASTTGDYRGIVVYEGTLDASTQSFSWTAWDSTVVNNPLAPHSFSVELYSDNVNPIFDVAPHMCWNEAGTVAYMWTLGVPVGQDASVNQGWQPIVWKYDATGGTPTWSLLPSIDYTLPEMEYVLDYLDEANFRSLTDPSIPKRQRCYPNFAAKEDFDGIVDANNNLHIFSTLYGVNDSINGHEGYVDSGSGETFFWDHYTSGKKPYLWDFIYTGASGSPWKPILVDSLGSESPGYNSGSAGWPGWGFSSNPWSADGATKPNVNARLQLSRSADGKYILYTWSDSDYDFTQTYWNREPNLFVRAYNAVEDTLYPQKHNITLGDDYIENDAFFHYASPKSKKVSEFPTAQAGYRVNMMLPMSITTSGSKNSQASVVHYYASSALTFSLELAAPTAPTGLAVANDGSTLTNNVSWTDNSSDETGFELYYTIGSAAGTYSLLTTVAANVITYAHTGLEYDTDYCYKVSAVSAAGNSPFSNDACAKIVGIKENALNSVHSSVIYPNPAKNNATLAIDLKDNAKVEVAVMNLVGQTVKTTSVAGVIGSNKVNVDLDGLSAGIYLVNVKVGVASHTKKLIIE